MAIATVGPSNSASRSPNSLQSQNVTAVSALRRATSGFFLLLMESALPSRRVREVRETMSLEIARWCIRYSAFLIIIENGEIGKC
jgi:hypothetical protein